jgi:hypothetical protein
MNVGSMIWSGKYLSGAGELVVSRLFLINRGYYSTKFLSDITIYNLLNFTIDSSLSSSTSGLKCSYCQVVNEPNSTFLSNEITLRMGGTSSSSTIGYGSGLVNKGIVVIRYRRTTRFYWNVRNLGTIKVVADYRYSSSRFHFFGRMVNDGYFQVYGGKIYFRSAARFYPCNGSYEIYGYPFRTARSPSPMSQSRQWQWKEYLADIYHNMSAGIWDISYTCVINIQDNYGSSYQNFNRMTGYGKVQLTMQSYQVGKISFLNGLHLGRLGELSLRRYSRGLKTVFVGKSAFTASLARINSGWNLIISNDTEFQIYRRLIIAEDAVVNVYPGTAPINLTGTLTVGTSGTMIIHGRECTIDGHLYLSGTLALTSSAVRVSGKFFFTQGYVGGDYSSLYVNKIGNVTGRFQKVIDGTSLYIDRPTQSTNNGVIAEYFQYRVDTDVTRKIGTLYYFPKEDSSSRALPLEFDFPQSQPNKVEFLTTFDRLPQYYGSSPLAISPTYSNWFDTQSSKSFTYGYACRLWSFLQLHYSGWYTFHVDTGYGLRVRLWINDAVMFASKRHGYFLSRQSTKSQWLDTGLNRIRVDFIQESAYWSTQNALVLTYSGPGFSDKSIPVGDLFVKRSLSNGTVIYANPSFAAHSKAKFIPEESMMELSGTGLIFAKNGAKVFITKTGIFNVTDQIAWISWPGHEKCMIINSGKIVRSGASGLATFSVDYRDAGGSIISENGMIELRYVPTIVFWNNSGGGNWSDPQNWFPSRVPGSHDTVYITLEGAYVVTIPERTNVSIASLYMGFQASISIERFCQLFISNGLDVNSEEIVIYGKVMAEHVTWRGQKIQGHGEIIANYMDIMKGSYNRKYLSGITIKTLTNFVVDSSLNSQNSYLYCGDCVVINGNMSTALANIATWVVQSVLTFKSKTGLVNYGLVVFELDDNVNIHWDVYNYGEIKVVTKIYGRANSFNAYGRWVNYNVTNVYVSNFYLNDARSPEETFESVWNVYAYPVRYQYAPTPGDRSAGMWREYLADVYKNASDLRHTLWNPTLVIRFTTTQRLFTDFDFGRLNSYGTVEFHFHHVPSRVIRFSSGLYVGRHGRLYFERPSTTGTAISSAVIGRNVELTAGDISIAKDWNITISDWSSASLYRSTTLHENGTLIALPMSTLTFHDQLTLLESSSLEAYSSRIICYSSLYTGGNMALLNSSFTVYGHWQMLSGAVTGQGATVDLHGKWTIASVSVKNFEGVHIILAQPPDPSSSREGVIADYFQYRVTTEYTRKVTGFLNLSSLPVEAYATPNVERIEHSLHRYPILYGSSPLYYSLADGSPTTDNAGSFTYQYGARLWMYLEVDESGDYVFYFLTGDSLVCRLWIDGKIVFNSGYYNDLLRLETAGPFRLQRGYRKLRIDFVQGLSSNWEYVGNTLIVYYSGPGFAKKIIPQNKIYLHNGFRYAKETYNPPLSSTGSLSGGPVVAHGPVNVTICSTCDLQINDGIVWYTNNTRTHVSLFINFGLVIRKGQPGAATIFGKYVAMPGSRRVTEIGLLEFRDGDSLGNLVTWNNRNGGNWTDSHNWIPQRIPRPQDGVHITYPGRYQVTIPAHYIADIAQLVVGSYVSLVIESDSSLNVSGMMILHSRYATVKGLLTTGRLLWFGEYLSGTRSYQGKIVTTSSLSFLQCSFFDVHFRYITIENRGDMIMKCQRGKGNSNYYCTDCAIYNYGTFAVSGVKRLTIVNRDGQRQTNEIFNYGSLALETPLTYSSSLLSFWRITNYGNISVINMDFERQSSNWYVEGELKNYGNVRCYMTNVYIRGSAGLSLIIGSWEMYGKPYRPRSLPNPPGYRQQGLWQSYLDSVYQNQSNDMWDLIVSFQLNLRDFSRARILFSRLQFYGPCHLSVSPGYNTTLHFQTLLNLGQHSILSLFRSTTSTSYITFGSNSSVVLNRALIPSGWIIDMTRNSTLMSFGRVVLLQGSTLKISNGALYFKESLYSSVGSKFVLTNSHMTVYGPWMHQGDMMLHSSTVAVEDRLDWQEGSLMAKLSGNISVQRSCKFSSTKTKILSGATLIISGPYPYKERHGVVAEYFQYRVKTSSTSPKPSLDDFPGLGSPTYSLPLEFNFANTTANVIRLESHIIRHFRSGGNGPLAYKPKSLIYNYASTATYSYSYAARLWTYLKIEHSGTYVFYFQTPESVRVRLWVDDDIQFISSTNNKNWNEEKSHSISFSKGMHKVRLDYIQQSSSFWKYEGGAIIVLYEGPHTPKQVLPEDKLYSVWLRDAQPVAAAVNWKFLPTSGVCALKSLLRETLDISLLRETLDKYQGSVSHCNVKGKGLVVKDGASIIIKKSGILNFQRNGIWPKSVVNGTKLTVKGMVVKTGGEGITTVTTDFDEIVGPACRKQLFGTLCFDSRKCHLSTGMVMHLVNCMS